MTVHRLLSEIPAGELAEWQAFARMEPFGCEADDWRAGIGAAVTHNMSRAKGAAALLPHDFFPWAKPSAPPEPKPMTPDERARAIAAMLGKGDYK